jgi:hypothetical protein
VSRIGVSGDARTPVGTGSFSDLDARSCEVRSTLDTVAKVENRTTLKISRKLILSCLYGCNPP